MRAVAVERWRPGNETGADGAADVAVGLGSGVGGSQLAVELRAGRPGFVRRDRDILAVERMVGVTVEEGDVLARPDLLPEQADVLVRYLPVAIEVAGAQDGSRFRCRRAELGVSVLLLGERGAGRSGEQDGHTGRHLVDRLHDESSEKLAGTSTIRFNSMSDRTCIEQGCTPDTGRAGRALARSPSAGTIPAPPMQGPGFASKVDYQGRMAP